MKSYFIVSAIGKDRPGIAADVSEVIFDCGGNIEDSSMTCLRTHFALLLLFSTEKEEVDKRFSSGLNRLESEKDLIIFFSPITLEEVQPWSKEVKNRFKITTSGVDHAGIVFRVCRLLADRNINILDMKTHPIFSPETGTPIFEMEIDIEAPDSVSYQSLREDLHRLSNELVIDIVVRKV